MTLFVKVHLCKLHNNKYMMASTQIRNTEILVIIEFSRYWAVKFCLQTEKTVETTKK